MRTRRRRLGVASVAAIVGVVALTGCGRMIVGAPEVGSGTSATEERAVAAFTEVRVSNAIRAEISVGAATAVRVTADDNILDNVRAEVAGSRLDVSIADGVNVMTPVRVSVSAPTVTSVDATSAARVVISGVAGGSLRVAAESSARVEAEGRVESLEVRAGSAGHLELTALEAGRAAVDLDSAGVAKLTVTQAVAGRVSSAASLTLAGDPPTVDVSTSSAGIVRTE